MKFCLNTTTYDSGWIPNWNIETVKNRSSVSYDILNNENKALCPVLDSNLMNVKLNFKKKCLGEFHDLSHTSYPNFCDKYQNNIKENKNIYRNYKGVFTNMYDTTHRNGNLIELFKNPQAKKEEPKHVNSLLKTKWANNSNRIKNAREFAKNLLKGKIKNSKDSFFSINSNSNTNTIESKNK